MKDEFKYLAIKDQSSRAYTDEVAKWIERKYLHDKIGGDKLLDLGCGLKAHGQAFERLGYDVTYCDFEPEDISIDFCDLNDKIPYEDNTFDVIYCWQVIEHLIDTRFNWIYECHRILKPGGRLIFSTPDFEKGYAHFYNTITHFMPYTRHGLAELIARMHWKTITLKRWINFPYLWKLGLLWDASFFRKLPNILCVLEKKEKKK